MDIFTAHLITVIGAFLVALLSYFLIGLILAFIVSFVIIHEARKNNTTGEEFNSEDAGTLLILLGTIVYAWPSWIWKLSSNMMNKLILKALNANRQITKNDTEFNS